MGCWRRHGKVGVTTVYIVMFRMKSDKGRAKKSQRKGTFKCTCLIWPLCHFIDCGFSKDTFGLWGARVLPSFGQVEAACVSRKQEGRQTHSVPEGSALRGVLLRKEALPAHRRTSCWRAAPASGAVVCQEAPVWDRGVCSRSLKSTDLRTSGVCLFVTK